MRHVEFFHQEPIALIVYVCTVVHTSDAVGVKVAGERLNTYN
jgi:hypothetical protein